MGELHNSSLTALPSNPLDLLTPEERSQLDADLRKIATCRRRAEREAANLWMA